mmetsp:Transcript_30358/g.84866  ORF Transcript_30358/g.84866 Transcript_30358/m.84866 type:complete len:84 (+) Transcript_30358:689-940(+)
MQLKCSMFILSKYVSMMDVTSESGALELFLCQYMVLLTVVLCTKLSPVLLQLRMFVILRCKFTEDDALCFGSKSLHTCQQYCQ